MLTLVGGLMQGLGLGIGGMAGWALARTATAMVDPLLLLPQYAGQKTFMTGMPDISMAMQAYMTGTLDEKTFDLVCEVNNQISGSQAGNKTQQLSKRVFKHYINSVVPKLTLEQLIYAFFAGIIDDKQYKEMSARYKILEGQEQPLFDLMYSKFDMGTITSNYFRGTWEKKHTQDRVRRLYGCSQVHANEIVDNMVYIPPPSDILRFLVKDVYDENQIKLLGLDDEFDTVQSSMPWLAANGISENTTIKYKGKSYTRNIPRDAWISHWDLMSPTQGYEAYHRVREDRLKRFDPRIKDLKPFTWDVLNGLLKSKDYVPEQRKWLAAIASKQLGRIDLRRMFNKGTMDEKELREQYRDLGYQEADVKMLMDYSIDEKKEKEKKDKEKESKENYGKLIAEIYASFEVGAIEKMAAFNALVLYGVEDATALAQLSAIEMRIARTRVKYLVKMIKDEFFLGLYDGLQAYAELRQGGLTDIRSSQYVILWQRQLSRPRRMVSINTITDWLKQGLLSFEDARKRLINLGLSDVDTLLYLEMSRMEIQRAINLEQVKRAKTEQQKADEAKRLEKEARQAKKTSIADLKAYSPISQIGKWIQSGLLDTQEAVNRMRFMEVPETDIQRYLLEWGAGNAE